MITKAEELTPLERVEKSREERSKGFIDELLNLCDTCPPPWYKTGLADLRDKWEMRPDEVRIVFVEFNEMLDFLENNQPQKRH